MIPVFSTPRRPRRLIRNIASLGHHVTSRDFDLRLDFERDLVRSTCTCFEASLFILRVFGILYHFSPKLDFKEFSYI